MSETNSNPSKKISFKERFGINSSKVLTSLLAGFTVPFVLLICATFSVFFSNSEEFTFVLSDFASSFILISLGAFVLITLALLLTKGTLRHSIFTLCSFLVTAAYIQSLVTNLTFQGMPGDGNVPFPSTAKVVINFTVWAVLCCVFLWFGILSKKAKAGRSVMSFLLVLVLVMQTVSLIPSAIEYSNSSSEPSPDSSVQESNEAVYLTTNNMFELSTKKNIVVFILDRLDKTYLDQFLNSGSPYIDSLDGFTYYGDNISKYPRTYPAVTSMLTGINTDYTLGREAYFEHAYTNGTLLKDLHNNNYKVNLYIPTFYSYSDARVFGDTVSNTSVAEGYTITSKWGLTGKMFELSSYFWAPEIFKSNTISSSSFNELVQFNGDAPEYDMTGTSDPDVYKAFADTGLTTQSDQNTFTFLHLRGSHAPTSMDENCNLVDYGAVSVLQQTTGCFKLISEYITQMKKLGIYNDATIIITGDHASLVSDTDLYEAPKLTGLLVKESGQYGTEIKYNTAQVSQDNFQATIIKAAGIQTNTDYGRAYSEVPVGEDLTRTHYFQIFTVYDYKDENLTYEITGKGSDLSNWKITNREHIGFMYK